MIQKAKFTKLTGVNFSLGQTVATQQAHQLLHPSSILSGLSRHVKGDWGELDDEDWQANNRALVNGTRIFSVYKAPELEPIKGPGKGATFWIITEADRSSTCVLLPEDY